MLHTVEIEIVLASTLAHAIRTDRLSRVAFSRGKCFLFAIHSTAGRGKDHFFHLRLPRSLKHVEHTEQVDASVKEGISDGAADIHLRGMVIDHINFFRRDELPHGKVHNISMNKMRTWVQIFTFPG